MVGFLAHTSVKYYSDDGKFSILMPNKPEVFPIGKKNRNIYGAFLYEECKNAKFQLTYIHLTPFLADSIKSELKKAKESSYSKFNFMNFEGNLYPYQVHDITLDGYPGIDFEYRYLSVIGNPERRKGRLYLVNQRVYTMLGEYYSSENGFDDQIVDKFLNSFKLHNPSKDEKK